MAEQTLQAVDDQYGGIAYPFSPSAGGVFAKKPSAAVVGTSILNLLTTPVGYAPWNPRLGNYLNAMRFSVNDGVLHARARYSLLKMIEEFEPRARVVEVLVGANPLKPNETIVRIVYRLVTDEQQDLFQVTTAFTA